MKLLNILFSAAICALLIAVSCQPLENASEIPAIKFKSFNRYLLLDTTISSDYIQAGELAFDFTDGDADFGSYSADDKNLIMLPYEKVDGIYYSVDSALYGRPYSVLNDDKLERNGKYTTIEGEIKVQVYYFFIPPFDTMRYDFYILDRAGHKSNVASTTDIAF
jgi:hypothetical protein